MKNQVQFSISVSKTRAILLFTIKIIETFELHASIPGMWSAEYQTTIPLDNQPIEITNQSSGRSDVSGQHERPVDYCWEKKTTGSNRMKFRLG